MAKAVINDMVVDLEKVMFIRFGREDGSVTRAKIVFDNGHEEAVEERNAVELAARYDIQTFTTAAETK